MNSQVLKTNDVVLDVEDEGRIASIVLNRPAKRNAISPQMAKDLLSRLGEGFEGPARVLLLRSSAEGVFCAGFDISYIGTAEEAPGNALLQEVFTTIEEADKVAVSYADGLVVGGGNELFLSCDLRLATPRTTFRITPARLSVVYPLQGLARFVRVVGPTAAAELLLAARQITAEEALRIGLVTRIVPNAEAALAYCREVAECAPLSQRAMKAMLRHLSRSIAPPVAAESLWRHFDRLKAAAHASEDHREAVRAFAEKRTPSFHGR